MAIYRCEECERFMDNDLFLMEIVDDKEVCPARFEKLNQECELLSDYT